MCGTSTIRNKQVPFKSPVRSPPGLCLWAGLPRGLNWASWSKNKLVCLIRSLSCRPRISAQSLVWTARTPRRPSRSSEAVPGRRAPLCCSLPLALCEFEKLVNSPPVGLPPSCLSNGSSLKICLACLIEETVKACEVNLRIIH